jgi:hypothetical protein
MVDAYLQMASLLVVAFLFGGMLLFSAGFAAFLFKYLPPADVRMFYLFVILSSGLAAALTFLFDPFSATLMAAVMLTTIPARQVLMPAINQATDSGHKKRFLWLHGFSVLLTLGHIILAAVALIHMGS